MNDHPLIGRALAAAAVAAALATADGAIGADYSAGYAVNMDAKHNDNIRLSENVRWTMVNGRLYDGATLDETGSRERKRPKYWWEP